MTLDETSPILKGSHIWSNDSVGFTLIPDNRFVEPVNNYALQSGEIQTQDRLGNTVPVCLFSLLANQPQIEFDAQPDISKTEIKPVIT